MLDTFARFFLSFSNIEVVLPLVILGYIWLERNIFYHAICLIMISMILNPALKSVFQIPLPPHLGEGFAFHSGHMQLTIILYSWIAINYTNKFLRAAIALLLTAIGFSLMYFGYHHLTDILGSVFFGSLLLISYSYCARKFENKTPYIAFIFCVLLMFYNAHADYIRSYSWLAFYALSGALLARQLMKGALPKRSSFILNICSLIICTATIITVNTMFASQFFDDSARFVAQSGWLIIGFMVLISPKLSAQILTTTTSVSSSSVNERD